MCVTTARIKHESFQLQPDLTFNKHQPRLYYRGQLNSAAIVLAMPDGKWGEADTPSVDASMHPVSSGKAGYDRAKAPPCRRSHTPQREMGSGCVRKSVGSRHHGKLCWGRSSSGSQSPAPEPPAPQSRAGPDLSLPTFCSGHSETRVRTTNYPKPPGQQLRLAGQGSQAAVGHPTPHGFGF